MQILMGSRTLKFLRVEKSYVTRWLRLQLLEQIIVVLLDILFKVTVIKLYLFTLFSHFHF